MPITKVQTPDGSIIKVEHPEGATKQQIFAFAKQASVKQPEAPQQRQAMPGEIPGAADIPASGPAQPPRPAPSFVQKGLAATRSEMPGSQALPAIGRILAGAPETALTMGTGIAAEPVSGAAGLLKGGYSAARGGEFLGPATQAIEGVREAMTFQPRSAPGQELLQTVAQPFEAMQRGGEYTGGRILENTGSPLAATTGQLGFEAIPAALGLKGARGRLAERRQGITEAQRQFDESGVAPAATREKQIDQLVRTAEDRHLGGRVERGTSMEDIQAGVRAAKQRAKQNVNDLYDAARGAPAGISVTNVKKFSPLVNDALKDFDVADMPIARKRLEEIRDMEAKAPNNAFISLKGIEDWRRRLNRNRPPASDRAQNAALDVIKNQLDEFVDAAFDADMIKGDPLAVSRWKDARSANTDYRRRFSKDKVISRFVENESNPDQMRSWVFGASAVGAKKEAANVVKSIKNIVGEDSPQFTALRQDALLDVMEPLIREEPNVQQFVRNYDRMVRNNPAVVRELLPETSRGALKSLRNVASAVGKREPTVKQKMDLSNMGAVALFGHGISRAGLKVRTARDVFRAMVGRPVSAKRETMASLLGYDPYAPVLPKAPIAISGGVQTLQDADENQQ